MLEVRPAGPSTSGSSSASASRRSGRSPGRIVATAHRAPADPISPVRSAGIRPAWTSDDLPQPDVPTTARKRWRSSRSSSWSTCSSRPKKTTASSARIRPQAGVGAAQGGGVGGRRRGHGGTLSLGGGPASETLSGTSRTSPRHRPSRQSMTWTDGSWRTSQGFHRLFGRRKVAETDRSDRVLALRLDLAKVVPLKDRPVGVGAVDQHHAVASEHPGLQGRADRLGRGAPDRRTGPRFRAP